MHVGLEGSCQQRQVSRRQTAINAGRFCGGTRSTSTIQPLLLILRALRSQPRQLLREKVLGIHQIRRPVNNPLLWSNMARVPSTTTPFRPLLQISVLVHAPTSDREDNRLVEALPLLAETCLNASPRSVDTAWHSLLLLLLLLPRLACVGHRASCVRVSGIEVQVALCFGDGRGRGILGVHEGFGNLGEREVAVRGEEGLDAGDERVDVEGEAGVFEAVSEAGREGTEASEKIRGGGWLLWVLRRRSGHHCHLCDLTHAVSRQFVSRQGDVCVWRRKSLDSLLDVC